MRRSENENEGIEPEIALGGKKRGLVGGAGKRRRSRMNDQSKKKKRESRRNEQEASRSEAEEENTWPGIETRVRFDGVMDSDKREDMI